MGAKQHVILERDPDTRAGTCAACGPVRLVKRGKYLACPTPARRYNQSTGRRRITPSGLTREEAAVYRDGKPCGICGAPPPTEGRAHHVDHDHATGVLRGVLCHNCNLGIGYFKDSSDLLRAAVVYLSR